MAPLFNVKPICGSVQEGAPVADRRAVVELANQTLTIINEVLDSLDAGKTPDRSSKQNRRTSAFNFSKRQRQFRAIFGAMATAALISAAIAFRVQDSKR
jgi:hypothetical protein